MLTACSLAILAEGERNHFREGEMMRKLFTVFLALSITAPATAQEEVPSFGLVFNSAEMSSLYFECRKSPHETLQCDFNQTIVRKKTTPEKLDEAIAAAQEQLQEHRSSFVFNAEECQAYQKLIADLAVDRGVVPHKLAPNLLEMPEGQKADLVASLKAISKICEAPTLENVIRLVELSHAKDLRTCRVSSHSFQQTLRRVAGSDTWTANDGPHGPCGIINVSRLERAKDSQLFWEYISQKVITNPGANAFGSMTCSELDQREYRYTWKGRQHFARCEYVEFGP